MIHLPAREPEHVSAEEARRRDALVISVELMPYVDRGVSALERAQQIETYLKTGDLPSRK